MDCLGGKIAGGLDGLVTVIRKSENSIEFNYEEIRTKEDGNERVF